MIWTRILDWFRAKWWAVAAVLIGIGGSLIAIFLRKKPITLPPAQSTDDARREGEDIGRSLGAAEVLEQQGDAADAAADKLEEQIVPPPPVQPIPEGADEKMVVSILSERIRAGRRQQ